MNALIFIQTEDGKISRSSIEVICGIQKLCQEPKDTITTISFNSAANNELANYKTTNNCFVNNINEFHPLIYTSALEKIINDKKPDIIVFPHTYQVRDWVPRLSARLNIPFISDCISINKNQEGVIATKQMYQGKVNADISSDVPAIISFQSGAFRADEVEKGTSQAESIAIELNDNNSIKPLDKFKESKGEVDLSSAEIIVSVGRGISKEEHMGLVQELSESLSAELGSSRPVVDYGWLPHERQVGSSGQVVSPKLYLAVGISGAIQHQVGMKGSDNIMAINKDPNAPIFEIADYGIIGDLFEIVPKLTELIKKHQS